VNVEGTQETFGVPEVEREPEPALGT